MTRVVVNGKDHDVDQNAMTYEDVVTLAVEGPSKEVPLHTVTFKCATMPKPEGILYPHSSTKIQDGTIFNAYVTGAA